MAAAVKSIVEKYCWCFMIKGLVLSSTNKITEKMQNK